MNESIHAEAPVAALPLRTMLLAVLAPFGVIALMASPLAFNALRAAAGL